MKETRGSEAFERNFRSTRDNDQQLFIVGGRSAKTGRPTDYESGGYHFAPEDHAIFKNGGISQ